MRHGTRSQRLSLPTARRQAVIGGLVRNLVIHGEIRTTYARAKEAQRLADRLVTLGKNGSVHSRRQAFRVLQDRSLVKQLFAEIAPRYVDVSGGYTRVLRLEFRRGDGAQKALLALSRLPAIETAPAKSQPPAQAPQPPAAPKRQPPKPAAEKKEKPKSLFEGLRNIWPKKKKGIAAS